MLHANLKQITVLRTIFLDHQVAAVEVISSSRKNRAKI
jgi:hypothetical protein